MEKWKTTRSLALPVAFQLTTHLEMVLLACFFFLSTWPLAEGPEALVRRLVCTDSCPALTASCSLPLSPL